MLYQFYYPIWSKRNCWCHAIIMFSLAFGMLTLLPVAQAQEGSTDPVANVEITVGSGSTDGVINKGFAWRDEISSVPVTINCTDAQGNVVPNAPVSISVTSPGTVSPTSGTTDNNGNVSTTLSSTDINMDNASVSVSATSEQASGTASVLLKGIQVGFAPSSVRMGIMYPVTDTVTVVPAYDVTRIGITSTGQSRASITTASQDANKGTMLLLLNGQSGSLSKSGDQWLVPNVSGSQRPMVPIVVIVPARVANPHPHLDTTPITPVNRALDASTSPAAPGLPAGDVYLITQYAVIMTIQVVDQFGDNLDNLYVGAPISEGGYPINQNMSASGTYSDPVGQAAERDNGPVIVSATSTDATQWVAPGNTHFVPAPQAVDEPQNLPVEVIGVSLNPAIVNRVVSSSPPNKLAITWPAN